MTKHTVHEIRTNKTDVTDGLKVADSEELRKIE